MAAGVTIDIPGIGNVEAKNAATEATLKEILKAIQKGGLGGKGTGGTGAGANASAGAAGAAGVNQGTGVAAKGAAKGLANTASMASKLGGAMGKLAGGPLAMVAGAVVELGEGVTKTISAFANVGDSVENAANIFSGIPIVGTMFTAVASASQKVNDAYLSAAKGGATFGGSVNQFAASASAAGMTLDKFGDIVRNNGVGMLGFGDTVEGGAMRFAKVAKNLQSTASGLQALGYSTEDINGGLARYGELLRLQGQQRGKSDADLTAGAKKYLTEIDQLAKITGEERSAKEAQMKQLATDAQFRMFLAGKDEKVGEDFRNMVGSFGPKLGGFVKDYMATGTLTTEANQKMAAMLGGDVMNEMGRLRQKLLNNQRLTDEEQDRLKSIMAKAAKANSANASAALAASRDMDDASGGLIEAMSLTDDAHKKSKQEQEKAQKETDGMNAKMQEAQKALARISNTFQMFLANSGILDVMIGAFKGLASIVQTVLMPVFTVFATVIKTLWGVIEVVTLPLRLFGIAISTIWTEWKNFFSGFIGSFSPLQAVFDKVSQAVGFVADVFENLIKTHIRNLQDAFLWIADTLEDYLYPAFDFVGRIFGSIGDFLKDNFLPIFRDVGNWFSKDFIPPIKTAIDKIWNFLEPVITPLQKAFSWLSEKVGNALRSFNSIGDIIDVVKLAFKTFGLNLKEMWYAIKDFIPGLKDATPEERAQLAAEQAELASEKTALGMKLSKQAEENLKKQQEHEAQRAKERAARDAKIAESRKQSDKDIYNHKKDLDKKAADDAKASVDTNAGPEELLKQFAKSEGSPLVPKSEATTTVENTKKSIEADAEKKKQEAEKAKAEADQKAKESEKKQQQEEEKKKGKTQESAESLLAQLNTNMSQLLKLTAQTTTNTYEQVQATKGLSGNLFRA